MSTVGAVLNVEVVDVNVDVDVHDVYHVDDYDGDRSSRGSSS